MPNHTKSQVEALETILRFEGPADSALRIFFRQNTKMGQKTRGFLAETIFDILRNKRLYTYYVSREGTGSLEERLFQYASNKLRAGVSPALREEDPSIPFAIRYSLPDWLAELLIEKFGQTESISVASSLLNPAPLDLRVNLIKSNLELVRKTLLESGIRTNPQKEVPDSLRVEGKPSLKELACFKEGWFEVQDIGSQIIAHLVAPKRGQTIVDFCAGAGGKTLAMASIMRSSGQIYACDISVRRLVNLRRRLSRSGATNVQPFNITGEEDPKLKKLWGRSDAVLVDAPCSGTGTLRRNPDLKWRMSPSQISSFAKTQYSLLCAASRLVKPGGYLIYCTCSLLTDENEKNVEIFSTNHPEWRKTDIEPVLLKQGISLPSESFSHGVLNLSPHRNNCDGFFSARWQLEK